MEKTYCFGGRSLGGVELAGGFAVRESVKAMSKTRRATYLGSDIMIWVYLVVVVVVSEGNEQMI